jgi:hypothetical protein
MNQIKQFLKKHPVGSEFRISLEKLAESLETDEIFYCGLLTNDCVQVLGNYNNTHINVKCCFGNLFILPDMEIIINNGENNGSGF